MSYQSGGQYGVPERPGGQAPSMRASHADRERAVDVLKAGFTEGRLDRDEYEQRLERVHRARTHGELHALVADLPQGPAAVPAPLPQYPQPYPVQAAPAFMPPPPPTNDSATAAMVCGLLTPVCGLTAVPAVVLGHKARAEIRRTGEGGGTRAMVGLALGWSAIGVFVLFLLSAV